MKKKLQKYLSGGKEGFSLVELIIVIAIMAILIGVIALAVIPYLAKSKESKDLDTLDTVCSALATAVADTKAKGSGNWKYGSPTAGSEAEKVEAAMKKVLGNGSTELNSDAAKDASIWVKYDAANNIIIAYGGTAENKAVGLEYNETGFKLNTSKMSGAGEAKKDGYALVVSN